MKANDCHLLLDVGGEGCEAHSARWFVVTYSVLLPFSAAQVESVIFKAFSLKTGDEQLKNSLLEQQHSEITACKTKIKTLYKSERICRSRVIFLCGFVTPDGPFHLVYKLSCASLLIQRYWNVNCVITITEVRRKSHARLPKVNFSLHSITRSIFILAGLEPIMRRSLQPSSTLISHYSISHSPQVSQGYSHGGPWINVRMDHRDSEAEEPENSPFCLRPIYSWTTDCSVHPPSDQPEFSESSIS